jgi:hypothetical protein
VLFAITVFSFVAIASLSIMNQGSATAERALEITLVRSEITSQAQTLRFLNTSFINAYQEGEPLASYSTSTPAGQWAQLMLNGIDAHTADTFPPTNGLCPTTTPQSSFILNTHTVSFMNTASLFTTADTYSQLVYTNGTTLAAGSVQGIWIQAIESPVDTLKTDQTNLGYVDFHINACWQSPSQSTPVTIGTIVRLYEPR